MTIVSEPYVAIALSSANQAIPNAEQRVLCVGQKGSGGTATPLELVENIDNNGQEVTLYEAGSDICMGIQAFKRIAPEVQIDGLCWNESASQGADFGRTFTFIFATEADASDTFIFEIGSGSQHKFTVSVAAGTSIDSAADSLVELITADANCPFGAVNNPAGTVTVTAKHFGNNTNYGLSVVGGTRQVSGMTCTMAQVQPGGVNSDLPGDTLDIINGIKYSSIIWLDSTTTELERWLDLNESADNEITDSIGIVASQSVADTNESHFTDPSTGSIGSLNNKNLIYCANQWVTGTGYNQPVVNEPPAYIAGEIAAIRAKRLKVGQVLTGLVTTNATRDQFGGPALASLPYFNTPLTSSPPKSGLGWTATEIQNIEDAGGFVIGSNTATTQVILGAVPTTYKTSPGGQVDITWKYLNYVDTARGVREYYFNNLKNRFAQSRLTQGSPQEGRDQVDDLAIIAYCEQLYQDLMGPDYVLVQAGPDAVRYFKRNLNVVLDMSTGTVTIDSKMPIVTQLRTIIYGMQISFDVNS